VKTTAQDADKQTGPETDSQRSSTQTELEASQTNFTLFTPDAHASTHESRDRTSIGAGIGKQFLSAARMNRSWGKQSDEIPKPNCTRSVVMA